MASPDMIFNLRFRATEFHPDPERSGLETIKIKNSIEYYDRADAVDRTSLKQEKTDDAFDYYFYRIGSSGAFNAQGDVDRPMIYDDVQKYKPQILYQSVFSFKDEFAQRYDIKDKQNIAQLIQKSMPGVIKALGLKEDNVSWYGFYHTNTEHPHVHVELYEHQQSRKTYRLTKADFGKVKSQVYNILGNQMTFLVSKDISKKKVIDFLTEDMYLPEKMKLALRASENNHAYSRSMSILNDKKNNEEFIRQFKVLETILPKKGSMKLNSKNMVPYHENIKKLVNLIKEDESVKPFVDNYKKELDKLADLNQSRYGSGFDRKEFYYDNMYRIKPKMVKDESGKWKAKQVYSLDSKIGNMILQNIKGYREDVKSYENSTHITSKQRIKLKNYNVKIRTKNSKYWTIQTVTYDAAVIKWKTIRIQDEAARVFFRHFYEQQQQWNIRNEQMYDQANKL